VDVVGFETISLGRHFPVVWNFVTNLFNMEEYGKCRLLYSSYEL
jgi:hypothetical protein